MSHLYELCAFCPKLCRHVCPVAKATGREAATPTAKMTVVYLVKRGLLPKELATQAAALCEGCGACTAHCKHQIPVAELLRATL